MPAKKPAAQPANTKKTLVLLDAHAIIHRAYHALPEFLSSKGEPTGALYGLSNMLMKIIADLKPDYIVACYDLPQKTFRHEAYKEYKAGRAKADDALISQLKSSRSIFEAFNIPIYDAPGFEADDVLGTIADQLKKNKGTNIIIASGDMDTMQLVDGKKVQIYTLKKGITDTILYDEDGVMERFGFAPKLLPDYKGLRGDPSDNIIGIKGVGEKTATDLIRNFGTVEDIYKKLKKDEGAFKAAGISPRMIELLRANEEEALFSKTLATIRRDAPVDFKIPEKTFWQNADIKKIEQIFSQYEFRSLVPRVRSFFGSSGSQSATEKLELIAPPSKSSETVKSGELMETSIALWLINSDISNPTLDDILNFANTDSFETAREHIFKKLKEGKLEKVYEEIEKPIMPIIREMQDHGILIDKNISLLFPRNTTRNSTSSRPRSTRWPARNSTSIRRNSSPKSCSRRWASNPARKKAPAALSLPRFPCSKSLRKATPSSKRLSTIASCRNCSRPMSISFLRWPVSTIGSMPSSSRQERRRAVFSSKDPNLQNLPIKSELGRRIRGGFIASPGHKLLALDYSQIELRVAAILSGDKNLTEIFAKGEDVHAGVASFVFGVPIDKVDAEMRRRAKVINFGVMYGMGVTALRKNLGGTREEAQKFYDNYFEQFSGIRDYLEHVKSFAMKNTYTETLFGRRRYFPNINSRIPFLKNMAERTAINAPIQGTATADIIKLSIRFAHEDLEKAGLLGKAHLTLQIHDELVYEVEEGVLKKAEEIIRSAMENVLSRSFLHYQTAIPLTVHSGSGNNLDEVK
ncbi:MAG: DNA polymerase [bacterium]